MVWYRKWSLAQWVAKGESHHVDARVFAWQRVSTSLAPDDKHRSNTDSHLTLEIDQSFETQSPRRFTSRKSHLTLKIKQRFKRSGHLTVQDGNLTLRNKQPFKKRASLTLGENVSRDFSLILKQEQRFSTCAHFTSEEKHIFSANFSHSSARLPPQRTNLPHSGAQVPSAHTTTSLCHEIVPAHTPASLTARGRCNNEVVP